MKISRVKKIAATIRKAHSLVDWRQGASRELFTICWLAHVPDWTDELLNLIKTNVYLIFPKSAFLTRFYACGEEVVLKFR
ncbi:MAG TPA: hypothetical protein DCQ57_14185 [Enterobacteriaceae bacterium]|nr:hypothetical protein [Enterobacteriaceae bacterium]